MTKRKDIEVEQNVAKSQEFEDLPVCPVMRCNSFCPFPEMGVLPCAKHGTLLVPYSEAPLRKHIYRWFIQKIFKIKYATAKIRKQ